jgi:hypothetical protein
MIFLIDEYADLFNHSNKRSAGMSDKDLEEIVASPYGYTPGQDSVRTDAQLTTGQTPLDIQSTGTLFSSYGEKSVQEILGNAMNLNASVSASSSSLKTMTNYAASFASSGRGGGSDSDSAVVVAEDGSVSGGVFQTERFGEVYTPTLGGRLSSAREGGSAPARLAGADGSNSLSEIRQSRQARMRNGDAKQSSSRAKRSLNLGGATKNYRFDARSNRDYFG